MLTRKKGGTKDIQFKNTKTEKGKSKSYNVRKHFSKRTAKLLKKVKSLKYNIKF